MKGIKTDIVDRLVRQYRLPRDLAVGVLDAVLDSIVDLTVERGTTRLEHFGCWQVMESAGRPIGVAFVATGRFHECAKAARKGPNGDA